MVVGNGGLLLHMMKVNVHSKRKDKETQTNSVCLGHAQ